MPSNIGEGLEDLATEAAQESDILVALRRLPDAPSEKDLQAMKRNHGSIYVTGFSEGEIYVYTHLERKAWKETRKYLSKMSGDVKTEEEYLDTLQENVVLACLLWPRKDDISFKHRSKGGTIKALYEQIMLRSNFWDPQQVAVNTIEI